MLLLVAAATTFVHWPALTSQGFSFDDDIYVTENPYVAHPSWDGAVSQITAVLRPNVHGYYHPLALVSFIFDAALGGSGQDFAAFHRTNLFLHAANTVLLAVLFQLLFGRIWLAAGLALIFGLHPITVETVAWLAARKALLAGFFTTTSLVCYAAFVQQIRSSRRRNFYYVASVLAYILGLLAKPTASALPYYLLLLDFWPLRRLGRFAIWEKAPFFVAGAAAAVVTVISHSNTSTLTAPETFSPGVIPGLIAYKLILYLRMLFLPTNLPMFHEAPSPMDWSNPLIVGSTAAAIILFAAVIVSLWRTRAVFVGATVFLLSVLPMLGFLRYGIDWVFAFDNYVYIAALGPLLVLGGLGAAASWSPLARAARARWPQALLPALTLSLLGAEAVESRHVYTFWQDPVALFRRYLATAPNSAIVHHNLAFRLSAADRLDEAIEHARIAAKTRSDYAHAMICLADSLSLRGYVEKGDFQEAEAMYRAALDLEPLRAEVRCNLAAILLRGGRAEEALILLERVVAEKPEMADGHFNRGWGLRSAGRLDDAIAEFGATLVYAPDHAGAADALAATRTLRENPNLAVAHNNRANELAKEGQLDEAVAHYREALRLRPDYVIATTNLAHALREQKKLEEALEVYRRAAALAPNAAAVQSDLGAMLMTLKRFEDASRVYEKALAIDPGFVAARNGLTAARQNLGVEG